MFQVHIPAVRAATLKDAFALVEDGGRWLNGGTDILVQAKEHMVEAARFVDISSIPELRAITVQPKKLVLGAATTVSEAMRHPLVREEFPALAMAGSWFASPQIRNRATMAGNIANASPAGDTIPALYAYDAQLTLRKKSGRRTVALREFIQGVRKTLLEPGELIAEIVLPRVAGRHLGSFIKIGQRQSLAISKTMIAVAATLHAGGTVKRIGIALGAVAPTILRLEEAERLLVGKKITPALAAEARRIALEAVRPIDDVRSTASYRRHVSGVIAERGLLQLASLVEA